VILRTSYAKLADPSRRTELASALVTALERAGHVWLHVGTPADAPAEVWDLAIVAACPDAAAVAEHQRRVSAVLGDAAVVTKAWSFTIPG
jgi:hypothetical protein